MESLGPVVGASAPHAPAYGAPSVSVARQITALCLVHGERALLLKVYVCYTELTSTGGSGMGDHPDLRPDARSSDQKLSLGDRSRKDCLPSARSTGQHHGQV